MCPIAFRLEGASQLCDTPNLPGAASRVQETGERLKP
jgi:hypothetical protein